MTVKAAIFDLDGTLLNTLGDLRASLEAALLENGQGRSFTDEEFKFMVGNGLTKLIERAMGPGVLEEGEFLEKVRRSFKKFYAKNLKNQTAPYPGIPELVTKLKADGFRLGVWTNKDEDHAKDLIEAFFPGLFIKVVGAAPPRPLKPSPQAGLELAEVLGAWPKNLWYLGDSETDAQSAQACGFIAVGVAWGFRSIKELRAAGVKVILEKPEDFYPVLEGFHG
ncbi:MAG: HAD family hydrolase [Deltaproteobacteria bacterium]|jgi:phosphoglycolate phosphatase|nr:HAD family hydrolase [Deltaproteobacteria bacterium]